MCTKSAGSHRGSSRTPAATCPYSSAPETEFRAPRPADLGQAVCPSRRSPGQAACSVRLSPGHRSPARAGGSHLARLRAQAGPHLARPRARAGSRRDRPRARSGSRLDTGRLLGQEALTWPGCVLRQALTWPGRVLGQALAWTQAACSGRRLSPGQAACSGRFSPGQAACPSRPSPGHGPRAQAGRSRLGSQPAPCARTGPRLDTGRVLGQEALAWAASPRRVLGQVLAGTGRVPGQAISWTKLAQQQSGERSSGRSGEGLGGSVRPALS